MSRVSYYGAVGTNGVNGSGPGVAGGAGGAGGGAVATNTGYSVANGDASSYVTAVGGVGGYGGNGGGGAGTGGKAGAGGAGGYAAGVVDVSVSVAGDLNAGVTARGAEGGATGKAGNYGLAGVGAGAVAGAGGVATAASTGANTLGDATVYAFAVGGSGGTGYGGGSVGGAGGAVTSATVSATASTASGHVAKAYLNAYGGAGGAAVGAKAMGGAGAAVSGASASASGYSAVVKATQKGGAGGYGYAGAVGGAGANSSLTNAVSGKAGDGAHSYLTLYQSAVGGAGGQTYLVPGSVAGATGGAGGAGASSLKLSNAAAAPMQTATSMGAGGNGGTGTGGANGGAGGAGYAYLSLASGGYSLSATATAIGGAGGAGARAGAGGGAAAVSIADQTAADSGGSAISTAAATAGDGFTTGAASATATAMTLSGDLAQASGAATGSSGSAQATATTGGSGVVTGLSALSEAPTSVSGATALSQVDASTVFDFDDGAHNAYAFGVIDPNASFLTTAFATDSAVAAILGASGAATFGDTAQGAYSGASGSGAQEFISTETFTLDTVGITGDLVLGMLGEQTLGAGFQSLVFTVSVGGVGTVDQTFTSLSAAQNYFTNQVVDLGSGGNSSKLAVTVAFNLTTDAAGSGFGADLLLGASGGPSEPVVKAPASATIAEDKTSAITGVSISEVGATLAETFTATLTDTTGLLAATGNGVSGSGSGSLTITGTLSEVNTALASLTVDESAVGADTIVIGVSDSFDGTATPADIAVTTNNPPALKAPASKTIAAGAAMAITGVSVAESNVGPGETFTVTLTDTTGLLSATGAGISGSGSASLTVSGSLTQVNAELATLRLYEAAAGGDTVHVAATDSLGAAAAGEAIKVTTKDLPVITAPSGQIIGLGLTTAIAGVSVSQVDVASGETFTVTLSDSKGLLSATGPDASGSGTTTLIISGELAEVNAELATLTDFMAASGANTVKVIATDSLGASATTVSMVVTANGLPTMKAPVNDTIGVAKTAAIAGVSLSEKGTTTGETFTVVLTDASGLLAVTGFGVTGSGTTSLTISGALAQVNADLATLTDTNATFGLDKISVATTDSLGNSGAAVGVAVTVAGDPVLAAPASKTIGLAKSTAITGVMLTESGATTSETFTVMVADTSGMLTATGTVVSGSGTDALTIHGTLAKVEAALASLKVTEAATGSDTISLSATDGFGNSATAATIDVTANGLPTIAAPSTLTTDTGVAKALTGVSIAETGTTTGETFTVILSDKSGLITATGTGVTASDSRKVTISGSLIQVNDDLATLTVTKAAAGADTITLSATDSLGDTAAGKTIAVTTAAPTGRTTARVHAFIEASAALGAGGLGLIASEGGSRSAPLILTPARHAPHG